MGKQGLLFPRPLDLPEGFVYKPEFLSKQEQQVLLKHVKGLEFEEVRMHNVVARRRVRNFGLSYSFLTRQVSAGEPLPEFLRSLRIRVAAEFRLAPGELVEGLVTQYPPGAPIGWHCDAPVFKAVAGISLLSPCRFRLRRRDNHKDTLSLDMQPRSLYLMSGAARLEWEHHIPPVRRLRYSVTFRSIGRASDLSP